jgi:hypothetical protein
MFSEIMVIGSIGVIAYSLYEKATKRKELENLKKDKELKKEIKICPADLKEEEKDKKIKEKISKYKIEGYKEIKREVKDDGYLYITLHNSLKNKLKEQVNNATSGIVVGVILLIVFGYFSLSSDNSTDKSSNDDSSEPTKSLAYTYCKDFVQQRLKNPDDADFETFWDTEQIVEDLGNGNFVVNSYVDATNSFGAKLRTRYRCKVKCDSDGCLLKQLKFK